jgi:hypothetical protein
MRTATCLTLLAIGAIFAFAITATPSFLNIHVAGWVIMATGVAGLLLPRRGQGWLRRRIVLRGGRRGGVVGHIDETRTPSYVLLNPSALEAVQPEPPAGDDLGPPTIPEPTEDDQQTRQGQHRNGRHRGGQQAEGQQAEDQQAEDQQAEDQQSDGSQREGEHRTAGPVVVDEEYLGE